MATAKPKTKRMMFGGMAADVASKALNVTKNAVATKPALMNMQNAARSAAAQTAFKPAAKQVAANALRKLPINPPRPGTAGSKPMTGLGDAMRGLGAGAAGVARGIAGSDLKRAGLMKKGGAVKKKVTKK